MPLGGSPSFLVRLVQLRILDLFKRNFAGLEVTPAGFSVFALIMSNPGIRPGEVAEGLMVKPSNIAALVNGLVATGLVRRETDATELRASVLQPTELGLTTWTAMEEAHQRTEETAMAALDGGERAALTSLLQKLLRR